LGFAHERFSEELQGSSRKRELPVKPDCGRMAVQTPKVARNVGYDQQYSKARPSEEKYNYKMLKIKIHVS
jgi:hypothetical protein